MDSVESRLAEIGLVLPPAPAAAGNYKAAIQVGELLFVSGQLPFQDGKIVFTGQVGGELTLEQGYAAARLTGLNVLAQVKDALGSFDNLRQIVRLDGHISSSPSFHQQPQVLNGASDLFAEALGERAGHARTVFAPTLLPLNATVELACIAAVRP